MLTNCVFLQWPLSCRWNHCDTPPKNPAVELADIAKPLHHRCNICIEFSISKTLKNDHLLHSRFSVVRAFPV